MANTYFQFKHFRVNQDLCGMKVCTDACILGAVAPVEEVNTILDIGTGTGLLALMAAQRSNAKIEAVEIDGAAAAQAKNNAIASQFSDRIKIHHCALQNFDPRGKKFDLIISNPPFFVNSLKSETENKKVAKHTDQLSFPEIVSFAAGHLTNKGKICILLPPAEQLLFASEAHKNGLHSYYNLAIKDTANSKVIRIIALYAFAQPGLIKEELLVIKEKDGTYSARFKEILKDFYLAF